MKKLSLREKAAYGVADIGASLTYVGINTWLLYFLINIVKLEPFLAGTVFLAGRVIDAVLDPLMGVWSDRLKPRFGRKRFILWGAVPLGLSFALLWLNPEGSQLAKFLSSLTLLSIFSACYTLVSVPYMALTPEIAPDYNERTSLTSMRAGFGTFASLIAVAAPPLIIVALSGVSDLNQSSNSSWLGMGLIFGVIAALAYLIMAFNVNEPKAAASKHAQARTAKLSFVAEYRSAFSIYGFKSIFLLFIIVTIGLMVINSILPFFLESNLRIAAEQQSIVLGSLFGTAILTLPLWAKLAALLGKRIALALGLGIFALSTTLLVAFSPSGGVSAYLIIMTVLAGTGLSAVILFPWAMLPDVVEFDELQTGRRREGLVYALFTFGQKIAGSIGVFSNALVASLFGYQQGLSEQAPKTLQAIAFMAGPAAAIIFVIAIFVTMRFPITKEKHQEVRTKLASNPQL